MGKRGRRRKQLLDLKKTTGCWELKAKALDPLCGEVVFEEAMDLSKDGLLDQDGDLRTAGQKTENALFDIWHK